MIISIASSIPTFKALTFRPGLNILLADITAKSTDKQTRNSAGKTSMIEIIHFLLGADADKNSLFKKPEIVHHSFTGVFLLRGAQVTVTRTASDERKIVLGGDDAAALGLELHRSEESGVQYVTLDEWKDFLGKEWFGLPKDRGGTEFDGAFTPTFRSIISYFVRRRKAGGYVNIQKQNEYQQPWDWQVNLSYLLGLDWQVPRALQDLRARKKTLATLRQAIKEGQFGTIFGTSAEIRPELVRAEERLARLKTQIESFRVLDSYREMSDQVSQIKNRMSEITVEIALVKETISYISSAIKEEKPPAYAAVETLYSAAGVELPQIALRRFDEVREFQQSVIHNRKQYLEAQIASARTVQGQMEEELADADNRKSEILRILDGRGAFEDLEHFPKRLNRGIPQRERIGFKVRAGMEASMDGETVFGGSACARCWDGQDGATIPETAEQLGVSISSVVRFRRLHRKTGSVSPAKFGGYKGYALAAHEELVRQLVAEQPDITLAELKGLLAKEKVTVGQSSIFRFLHHLNLRFKKKSAGRRAGPAGRHRRT